MTVFRCSRCFKQQAQHLRGMCEKCYLKAYPPSLCTRCKKRNAGSGNKVCSRCDKVLVVNNYHGRPAGDTQQHYTRRGGVPISNLLLSTKEQEEERLRRVEIYIRHLEQHGRILWGQCAPEDQEESPAPDRLSLFCSVSDSDTDLQED